MKRLTIALALAMCMLLLGLTSALAEETKYFVAYGEFDAEAAAKPGNEAAMQGHIEYLNKLYAEGKLFMGGPFGEGESGMLIFKASSLEEVREWLQADPSIAAGVIKPVFLRPWHAFMSKPDSRTMSPEQFQAMMAEGAKPSDFDTASSPAEPAAEMWMPELGSPMFLQVPSSDKSASTKFYSELFGWQVDTDPNSGMTFFTAPGKMMGEFSDHVRPAAPATGVVFYITTESVTAMLPRVEAAGGKVLQPLMKLPEDWGYIAIIIDPSGNAVGLWSAGE